MVKEAIDPSGSLPPNPVTNLLLLGARLELALLATGGSLRVGVGTDPGVGVGTDPGVGVGPDPGVGVGATCWERAATVAGAGLVAPPLSVARQVKLFPVKWPVVNKYSCCNCSGVRT